MILHPHHGFSDSLADTLPDCLFEGPTFPSLMAHIQRRHKHSTPEDFVPGLVHHRPSYLPPLPPLPRLARIHSEEEQAETLVRPYPKGPGVVSKRLVVRGCMSGRRPRKEDYDNKKRAMAAIGTIIENARQPAGERVPCEQSKVDDPMTVKIAVNDARLMDPRDSAEGAMEMAKPHGPDVGRSELPPIERDKGLRVNVRYITPFDEHSISPTSIFLPDSLESPSTYELKAIRKTSMGSFMEDGQKEQVKRSERLRQKMAASSTSGSPLGSPDM